MRKKLPSSKCSVGSEDSDLDLKKQSFLRRIAKDGKESPSIIANPKAGFGSHIWIKVYDIYNQRMRKDEISGTLRPNFTKGSRSGFVVSGQTTTTNMPVKSTEQGSETKNSLKATSETSKRIRYLNMTYLQRAFPVRLFPLRENARVFRTKQGELFSTKYAELLEVKDQVSYSLRMLKGYFLTTQVEPSQLYSFHWMSLGMMSNGRCLTLNIGCPRTVKGSLSSVLEKKVDEKYYLSEKMKEYFFRHYDRRPIGQDGTAYSLTSTDYKGVSKQRANVIFQLPRGKNKGGIKGKISPTLSISDFEHNNLLIANTVDADGYLRRGTRDIDKNGKAILTSIPKRRIRRLIPKECERLQGFPDDWTEGVSDTQRYKQMGNAVSVPVIEAIGRRILNAVS